MCKISDSYKNGRKYLQLIKAEFGSSYSTTVCCTYLLLIPNDGIYSFADTIIYIFGRLGKLNDAEAVYRQAKKEKSVNSKGWLARLLTGFASYIYNCFHYCFTSCFSFILDVGDSGHHRYLVHLWKQ